MEYHYLKLVIPKRFNLKFLGCTKIDAVIIVFLIFFQKMSQQNSPDDEDDMPQLSVETFSALQEFYKEQEVKEQIVNDLNLSSSENNQINGLNTISEDWQLSQFWYDEVTAFDFASEVMRVAGDSSEFKIACVSCPTLYMAIKKNFPEHKCTGKLKF